MNLFVYFLFGLFIYIYFFFFVCVVSSVPEDYKVNPGPVEAIAEHPTEPNKILIGYQRGLIVLWDKKNLCADQVSKL